MPRLTSAVNARDHTQGSTNSAVTLVEYGDYQCQLCKLFVPIIKQLQKELGHTLRFVFRHFPLQQVHPYAKIAAEAAEAAEMQNKFWEMHDLLYANQMFMNSELFVQLAEQLKLNIEQFKSDMQSSVVSQKIESDFLEGIHSGVNGIPCLYINEERYDQDTSYEMIKKALIQASPLSKP